MTDEFRGNNINMETSHVEGQKGGKTTVCSGCFTKQFDTAYICQVSALL